MPNFSLPFFYENNIINTELTLLYSSNPQYFNFQHLTFTFEGTLPYFYWSSQNYNNTPTALLVDRNAVTAINNALMPIVLDCSNPHLTLQDMLDVKNNAILNILENGSNKILISNPIVGEYINKKYPAYYLQADVFYQEFDPDKKYLDNITTIRQNQALLNSEYYKDIPKSKIEFCIGASCEHCDKYLNCLKQNTFYRYTFSQRNATLDCPSKQLTLASPEQIKNYIKQGYQNFYFDIADIAPYNQKEIINIYLAVFIKPEYHAIVGNQIKEALTNVANR